ncbi:hypothetical protein CEXT_609291 [Caerostris extrusa]|uniref:Uncharacterized protein n=1 Tax=Caerostris extrusa TaxID=172846 RepID=A0AAV4Y7B0_CAEEX|nr:hypothetical protein CEXT_609291 [Caerostris extrusa]
MAGHSDILINALTDTMDQSDGSISSLAKQAMDFVVKYDYLFGASYPQDGTPIRAYTGTQLLKDLQSVANSCLEVFFKEAIKSSRSMLNILLYSDFFLASLRSL